MSLLKSIKKATKRIFKGIKKRFKKTMKAVGKIMNSKWGKLILIAAAVFTAGAALGAWSFFGAASAAGGTAASAALPAASGFGGVAGGAASMTGVAAGSGAVAGGAAAGVAAAGGAAATATGGAGMWGKFVTGAKSMFGGGAGAGGAGAGAGAGAGGGGGGMFANLGKTAINFAKSPGGSNLIANTVGGMAKGQQAEEERRYSEERERYDYGWGDPDRASAVDNLGTPSPDMPNMLRRSRQLSEEADHSASNRSRVEMPRIQM